MSAGGKQGGVIQADRNAAAKLFGKTDWSHSQFVTGKRDKDEKVLAFMRHRLAHDTPATDTPEVVRLREVLEQVREYVAHAFEGVVVAPQALDAIDDIARAALAKHPTSPEDAA